MERGAPFLNYLTVASALSAEIAESNVYCVGLNYAGSRISCSELLGYSACAVVIDLEPVDAAFTSHYYINIIRPYKSSGGVVEYKSEGSICVSSAYGKVDYVAVHLTAIYHVTAQTVCNVGIIEYVVYSVCLCYAVGSSNGDGVLVGVSS